MVFGAELSRLADLTLECAAVGSMLTRPADSDADLPTLAADLSAVLADVLQADSDDVRVTGTCAVARQLILSPTQTDARTVTSRRRADDGDDVAELVCRIDSQLADERDAVSRREALR